TVAALGEGVTGFEIGQAVYGQANALSGQGSFAEFIAVKASSLAAKPDSTDFVSAAALPLVSASAYQALVDHMQLQSGQRILVHGGAGGIGTMAIQLAKHFGAYVITTASTADTDYVKNLGADQVIDYKTEDFSELVSDLDAVYDVIGGETNRKSYGVLKTGGVLVSMVEPGDESQASKYGIIYTHQFTKVTTERLCAVSSLVDGGELGVSIDKLFSLDQAGEALAYLKNAHPRGKVVLNIA
ncbi:MAG: NADP-dependent oxidoreductase, partial [Candidatus Saccharimonadales bacterium]